MGNAHRDNSKDKEREENRQKKMEQGGSPRKAMTVPKEHFRHEGSEKKGVRMQKKVGTASEIISCSYSVQKGGRRRASHSLGGEKRKGKERNEKDHEKGGKR